jgi:hypothetical protein
MASLSFKADFSAISASRSGVVFTSGWECVDATGGRTQLMATVRMILGGGCVPSASRVSASDGFVAGALSELMKDM